MRAKLLFCLSISLLLTALPVCADWVLQATGTTENLNAIYFLDQSATIGVAVGGNGLILKTTNSGANWSVKSSGTAQTLNDINFPAAADGYLLGAGGTLKRSTDNGESYANFIALAAADANAEFKKAAFNGANSIFVGSKGNSADSIFVSSSDGGASWVTGELASLNVDGAFLSSSANNANVTWVWGYNFSTSQYEIRRDGTAVWTGATRVRDLQMVDANTGYAAGESGLILKTTNGGGSGGWAVIPTSYTGITTNFNALYFQTANFGWIVGDGGVSAITANGGFGWSVNLIAGAPKLNDIYVSIDAANLVNGYLAGDSGKIYRLESPTITLVTPETKTAGWLGMVSVEGTGFLAGAYVNFLPTGLTTNDPSITVLATSIESATKLNAYIYISPEAVAGWRDLQVTNPDATTSQETGAFQVLVSPAAVQSWKIDGNSVATFKGTNNVLTVKSTPRITARAYSSSGVTAASLNAQVLVQESGGDYTITSVPQVSLTTVSPQEVDLDITLTDPASPGATALLILAFTDNAGNYGAASTTVKIAAPLPSPGVAPIPGSRTGKDAAFQYGNRNILQNGANINWRLRTGTIVYNYRLDLFDQFGRKIFSQLVNEPGGVVSSKKINIPAASFPHSGLMSAGTYTFRIINIDTGEELVRNQLWCVPWE